MTPCILCGKDSFIKLFDVGNYSLLKCVSCGLVKTSGVKKISYKNYHRDLDYSKYENHFRNFFLRRFELISRFAKKGKVLEVGCATGVMLEIFKKAGWEVWGVEPSVSAKLAEDKGIRVLNTTFDKANLKRGYFDVVIMNHTLEHFANPLEAIKKAHALIKKRGTIFIDVPNFGSLSSKLMGKDWPYILPEEHFHHFTFASLSKLLEKAGFGISRWEARSGIFDYGNPMLGLIEEFKSRKKAFVWDLITSPGALLTTLIKKGTGLSVVGIK